MNIPAEKAPQLALDAGQEPERILQGDEVARRRGRQGDLAGQPLQVEDTLQDLPELAPGDGRAEGLGDAVLARDDRPDVEERPQQPRAEQAPARGGHGEIDDVEQRVLRSAVAEVADELEVADGRRVEDEVVAGVDVGDAADEGQGIAADLADVGDERPGRGHGPRPVLEPEAGKRPGPEVAQDDAGGLGRVEEPALGRAQSGAVESRLCQHALEGLLRAFGIEDLLRRRPEELVGQGPDFGPGPLEGADLAGDEVEPGQAPALVPERERDDVGALLGLLGLDLDGRARRQDLDDLAPDDALGRLGVLDLLADGHLEALAQELRQVGADGVIGHAAHRHLLPRGQGDLEDRRRGPGVLVEHLVEVAQAEEQQGVGMELLDAEILLHHGGEGGVVGHERALTIPTVPPFCNFGTCVLLVLRNGT